MYYSDIQLRLFKSELSLERSRTTKKISDICLYTFSIIEN
jgi:hypothetical protein